MDKNAATLSASARWATHKAGPTRTLDRCSTHAAMALGALGFEPGQPSDRRITGGPDSLAQGRLRREQLGGVIGACPQMKLDRYPRCREALRNQDVLIPKQVEVAHIDVGGW